MAFFLLFLSLFFVSLIGPTNAKSGYLYSPGPEDKEALSDVEPIMDYMRPGKLIGETQSDYAERINHPQFLSDQENEDRVVEVSAVDPNLFVCVCVFVCFKDRLKVSYITKSPPSISSFIILTLILIL